MYSSVRGLLALGTQALWHQGDQRRGRKLFESAYRRSQEEKDPQATAAAALGSAGLWAGEYEGFTDAATVLDRLWRAVPAAEAARDGRLVLRLRARLAAEADQRSGEHFAILAVLEQARRMGDPVVLAETLNLAFQCLTDPGCGVLRREVVDEYLVASLRTRRPADALFARLWDTVALALEGSAEATQAVSEQSLSEHSLSELRTLLATRPNLIVEHCVQAIEVMHQVRAGRFDEAERLAGQCAAAGVVAGQSAAPVWRAAQLIAVRWYQGRISELTKTLQAIAAAPNLKAVDYSPQAWLAVAYAAAGEERHARAALAGLTGLGRSLRALPRTGTWLMTMYGIVEAAHLLGDRDAAEQAYQLLLPYAGLPIVAGPAVSCFGSVEHALGVAELTLANQGDVSSEGAAAEHLRRAVAHNTALGHAPAAALSRRRLARLKVSA